MQLVDRKGSAGPLAVPWGVAYVRVEEMDRSVVEEGSYRLLIR